MILDLSSLRQAVSSLTSAVATAEDKDFMNSLDEVKRKVVRAGVIQNFEFTFELCWKFIQRWLRINQSAVTGPLTRRDLFRRAARFGLIDDPFKWIEYSEARNLTAHTYNRKTADRIYAQIAAFLHDAGKLLAELEKSND